MSGIGRHGRGLALGLSVLLLWPSWSGAMETFDSLSLDGSARAAGLGGAYTALARDSQAMGYNPGGLGFAGAYEASFLHHQYLEEASQERFALATPWGLGFGLDYTGYGKVTRTTLSSPAGGLGTATSSDLAAAAGYGLVLGGGLGLGGSAKYLREKLDDVSASGYAFDLGALLKVPGAEGLSLAAAVLNIGPDVKFRSAKESLPLVFRGGAAYEFRALGRRNALSVDAVRRRNESASVHVGAETMIAGMVPLRLGFTNANQVGPGITGGAGWIYKGMRIDYAVAPFGDLGLTHRVSLAYRWGEGGAETGTGEASKPRTSDKPSNGRGDRHAGGQSETSEARLARGQALIDAGKFEDARRELSKALEGMGKLDPNRVVCSERLGWLAFKLKDMAGAKAGYSDAVMTAALIGAAVPGAAQAYAGMGRVLLAGGEDASAERYLAKALDAGLSGPDRKAVERELKKLRNIGRPVP